MSVSEFNFTQLLREPSEVVGHLEEGDVLIHRRDGSDLVVSLAERGEERREALRMLSHLLARLTEVEEGSKIVADAIVREFPWVRFLPQAESRQFVDEFVGTADACAEIDMVEPLVRLVREWKSTAAVWADPQLAKRLQEPVAGDGEVVPAPSA